MPLDHQLVTIKDFMHLQMYEEAAQELDKIDFKYWDEELVLELRLEIFSRIEEWNLAEIAAGKLFTINPENSDYQAELEYTRKMNMCVIRHPKLGTIRIALHIVLRTIHRFSFGSSKSRDTFIFASNFICQAIMNSKKVKKYRNNGRWIGLNMQNDYSLFLSFGDNWIIPIAADETLEAKYTAKTVFRVQCVKTIPFS